jgi:hypothetical protein
VQMTIANAVPSLSQARIVPSSTQRNNNNVSRTEHVQAGNDTRRVGRAGWPQQQG